eukprot:COSAG01_NODE_1376_length_10535_cov_103.374856_2_plen_106_part_00
MNEMYGSSEFFDNLNRQDLLELGLSAQNEGEDYFTINECCGRDHPHAGDDANIWRRPDPKKDFVLAVAFAVQRGCSNTLLRANSRRRNRRAAAVVDHENMNGIDA